VTPGAIPLAAATLVVLRPGHRDALLVGLDADAAERWVRVPSQRTCGTTPPQPPAQAAQNRAATAIVEQHCATICVKMESDWRAAGIKPQLPKLILARERSRPSRADDVENKKQHAGVAIILLPYHCRAKSGRTLAHPIAHAWPLLVTD
jgi:hypothetical protein